MQTILKDPAIAWLVMELKRKGRITGDLAAEAMGDPKLAKMIVQHELMHDVYGPKVKPK